MVDDELGFSSETSLRTQESKVLYRYYFIYAKYSMMQHTWYFLQTYLFVADKKVVGCVVAVVIQEVIIIQSVILDFRNTLNSLVQLSLV